MKPFGLKEHVTTKQRHVHGQPTLRSMKLPLKRLNKAPVRSKNSPQIISLSNQEGVFQFPVTVPDNSLRPITLPFKSHNVSSMSADNQDANFHTIPMVLGTFYGQENILKPITMPFDIQLLRNSVQISQSDLSQGKATQILQTVNSQEQAYQILKTEHLKGPGIQTIPTSCMYGQDRQTDHTNGHDTQTTQIEHLLQGPGVQIRQMEETPKKEVQILRMEKLHEQDVKTLAEEQIPEQDVQAAQEMENTQRLKTTFTLGTVESPVVLTESKTTFTSNQSGIFSRTVPLIPEETIHN